MRSVVKTVDAAAPRGFYQPRYRDKRTGAMRTARVFWSRDPLSGRRVSTGCRTLVTAMAWRERRRALAALQPTGAAPIDGPGVYAVAAGGYLKIGRSKVSIARRIRTIQADQPHVVEFIGRLSADPCDEARLRARLARFRVRGEWFELTQRSLEIVGALVRRAAAT